MGISLMKVNDNVNENYYYDGRYNRRNVEGKLFNSIITIWLLIQPSTGGDRHIACLAFDVSPIISPVIIIILVYVIIHFHQRYTL